MVLTLPLDFVQMMHCHMEQSVLMKMQLILRMVFVDQKLGNKRRRWNSILQSVSVTAARLAQLGERRSAEREAVGSNPGRTNTQGL